MGNLQNKRRDRSFAIQRKHKDIATKAERNRSKRAAYIDRNRDEISNSKSRFGYSCHCIRRFAERVLDREEEVQNSEIYKLAKLANNMIGIDVKSLIDGKYQVLESFKLVVRNGVAITILKDKHDE